MDLRDQRLQALTLQHQQIVIEMRNKYESKLDDLGHNSDSKLKGVLEIADQLKRELSEAQQSSDKHRNAVIHLKQQLQVWMCGYMCGRCKALQQRRYFIIVHEIPDKY